MATLEFPRKPGEENKSMAEIFASLPVEFQNEILSSLSEEEHELLQYDADFWLRPKQMIDGDDWYITALTAGRGFGKTRTGSEWIRKKVRENPGCRIALAGRTVADVRNVIVQGDSGILAITPPDERPEYKQHTASLHWPNGSHALLLSSESPDQARGPQFHFTLGDEFSLAPPRRTRHCLVPISRTLSDSTEILTLQSRKLKVLCWRKLMGWCSLRN